MNKFTMPGTPIADGRVEIIDGTAYKVMEAFGTDPAQPPDGCTSKEWGARLASELRRARGPHDFPAGSPKQK